MQKYVVNLSRLSGTIKTPPSKSETMRALLFASLAKGKSCIQHYLESDDTHHMGRVLENFGAKLTLTKDKIEIEGVAGQIKLKSPSIFAGNSGIILRFSAAVAALSNQPFTLSADEATEKRPMDELLKGLQQLGVKITPPLTLEGPLTPGRIKISGEDSQPVSALLIACSLAQGPIEMQVENAGEKPWVALTLSWFDRLNILYQNDNFSTYRTFGPSIFNGFSFAVPGDISTAAFPIGAALVTNSNLTIQNVDMHSLQGDKELIYLFQKMGALIEIEEKTKSIHVKSGGHLVGVEVDINDFIDALPILAVVACFAAGQTTIYNAKIAKQKECNRLLAMTTELKKLQANIVETEDGLIINRSTLKGGEVSSHGDHRIAMALAVAGLGAIGETTILDSACSKKTFPQFVKDFRSIHAEIREI